MRFLSTAKELKTMREEIGVRIEDSLAQVSHTRSRHT